MESYSTGMTGTKCDYAVVMFFHTYLEFNDQERNAELLKKFKKIWFFKTNELNYDQQITDYCKKWCVQSWDYYPTEMIAQFNGYLTTVTNTVLLADILYPNASLYFLGDLMSTKRTGSASWHDHLHDQRALLKLMSNRKMTCILNNPKYYR